MVWGVLGLMLSGCCIFILAGPGVFGFYGLGVLGPCGQPVLPLGFLLALVLGSVVWGVVVLIWLGWLTFRILAGPGVFGFCGLDGPWVE